MDAVTQASKDPGLNERFRFGRNWSNFLRVLDDDRIAEAEKSLQMMLGVKDLQGKRFLDVGCGSGLFSLAARRLGATVHSFDFDPESVGCAEELRRRYFQGDLKWEIQRGSILDAEYVEKLGQFDIVYSWGVLHHTGYMLAALGNVSELVAPGGLLFIAIYNDQGGASRRWLKVKQLYHSSPKPVRAVLLGTSLLRTWGTTFLRDALRFKPAHSWKNYKSVRGMSPWYDLIDWVGGYPFEVAKPEEIFDFFRAQRFELRTMKTCGGGLGCNEFVLQKL